MADLTSPFAKVKIYGMKKGAAAPIKSLRLVVLYCNDPYSIVFLVYTTGIPSYTPDVSFRCIY